jgi:hypothetical protein
VRVGLGLLGVLLRIAVTGLLLGLLRLLGVSVAGLLALLRITVAAGLLGVRGGRRLRDGPEREGRLARLGDELLTGSLGLIALLPIRHTDNPMGGMQSAPPKTLWPR